MPAITVDNTLVLPRTPRPDPTVSTARPVAKVVTAHRQTEGVGFSVRRPRDEIVQAIEDYQAGRLGIVPADQLAPRNFA
jgi:hypothetical protein